MNVKKTKKLILFLLVQVKNILSIPVILLRQVVSKDYRLIKGLNAFDDRFFQHGSGEKSIIGDSLWSYLSKEVPDYDRHSTGRLLEQHFVDPHPLFDTAFYLNRYFPDGFSGNPFAHYLREGWKEDYSPGPFFDPEIYHKRSGWQKIDGDPLTHYTKCNSGRYISPGRYFDFDYYYDQSPVALESVRNRLITHYRQYGIIEEKNPIPHFDLSFYKRYLERNDISARDPFSHYLSTADHSNNRPNEWFDPDHYIKGGKKDLKRSDALPHYLAEGVFEKRYINNQIEQMGNKPLISVVVPVYNPNQYFLNNCIRSVLYQTYPHWELCLADDCSTTPETRAILKKWADKDSRIKVTCLKENSGISIATNMASELATGDYLGFLDNDDELSPDCLFQVAAAVNEKKADIIYTDEDLIGEDGSRFSIFRKADFNPELLLSHNYITHFTVISKTLFESTGRLNPDYDGAQDYDLILKTSERARTVVHLDKVLYHWRASESSTSINHDQKIYAHDAGRKVLQGAMERRNLEASAENSELNFFYRLDFNIETAGAVTVIIWFDRISDDQLLQILKYRETTTYRNCRFIIVFNESSATSELFLKIPENSLEDFLLYPVAAGIGKSAALNLASSSVTSDFLVFIDQGITLVSNDWIEQLLGPFCLDDVGLVCGRVSIEGGDGNSYTVPDVSDQSADYFHDFLTSCSKHLNGLHCLQQVHCCSDEMTMIRHSLFEKLGGFDENQFANLFAMTDLSLRAAEKGGKILYTPHAKANMDTAGWKSRSSTVKRTGVENEMVRFKMKWLNRLQSFGGFYNRKIIKDNGINDTVFWSWLTADKQ